MSALNLAVAKMKTTMLWRHQIDNRHKNVAVKHDTGASQHELKATKCGWFRLGPGRQPTWSGPAPGWDGLFAPPKIS